MLWRLPDQVEGDPYPVSPAAVDPDGTVLLSLDFQAMAVDLATGAPRWQLSGTECAQIALGPAGSWVCTTGQGLALARDP